MEWYAASESMVQALLAENMTGQVVTELTTSSHLGTSENTGMPIRDDENPASTADICRFANPASNFLKYGIIHELAEDLDWFSAMNGPYASARRFHERSRLDSISATQSEMSGENSFLWNISSVSARAAYASTLSTHHAHHG